MLSQVCNYGVDLAWEVREGFPEEVTIETYIRRQWNKIGDGVVFQVRGTARDEALPWQRA